MRKQIEQVWFEANKDGNTTIEFVRRDKDGNAYFTWPYELKNNDQISMIEGLLRRGELQVCVFETGISVTRFNPNFSFG